MEKDKSKIKTSIGGQALIEGIMMRGPKKTSMAVRRPDGEIVLETGDTVFTGGKIKKIPLVRGIFSFVDSMITGYKSLMRSAELAFPEELVEKNGEADAGENADMTSYTDKPEPADEEKPAKKSKNSKKDDTITEGEMTAVMITGVVLGFALAIFLFKFLPEGIYGLLSRFIPALKGNSYGNSLLRAAITGIVKIIILVGYMAAVSLMKDIRRTFMYHGAEHKSIFCYEHGLELTVDNVKMQSRFHPRCGTSFLVLSVLVSILVNMFIPNEIIAGGGILNTLARTGIGLLLLPVTMGFGYELIRIAGRHDNRITRIISAPGMWLQHITTKEPTPDMIECAIAALREVIPDDGSDYI